MKSPTAFTRIARPMANFLKHHLWAVFLLHQLLIFTIAVAFLSSVRRVTGRTIHAGRDPVGLIDGAALVILSVGVIAMTSALYRWVKGESAPPLGISLSPRRVMDLIAGGLLGFCLIVLPYVDALLRGAAAIDDRLSAHFGPRAAVRVLVVALFLLLLQAVMEETANRAFPMRLWEQRSLLFRILVPSIFFAALHLADERFGFERAGILLMAGVIHSLAYALTGNIWLATGVHAGANYATFSVSGLWHAGAIARVRGEPSYPNWVSVLLLFALFSVVYMLSQRYKMGRLRSSPGAVDAPGANASDH